MDKTQERKLRGAMKKRMKLWAEGNKLRAEGDVIWAVAVIKNLGNVVMDWRDWPACSVEGVKFGGEREAGEE